MITHIYTPRFKTVGVLEPGNRIVRDICTFLGVESLSSSVTGLIIPLEKRVKFEIGRAVITPEDIIVKLGDDEYFACEPEAFKRYFKLSHEKIKVIKAIKWSGSNGDKIVPLCGVTELIHTSPTILRTRNGDFTLNLGDIVIESENAYMLVVSEKEFMNNVRRMSDGSYRLTRWY